MSLNSDDPNHFANIYNQTLANKEIKILDSTLREGEQHPGVSFTNKQRIQIAWLLDSKGLQQMYNTTNYCHDPPQGNNTTTERSPHAPFLAQRGAKQGEAAR